MVPATADDVFDLLDAYVLSAALGAAMETGLFWLLAEQPLDAQGVALALGIPTGRCRYWLQLLSAAGLVEEDSDGYAPSPTARSTILDAYSQATWAFLAREVRERYPAVLDLALHIREPGSTWAVQGLQPPDYLAQLVASPRRARAFTRMLYEIHLPLADALTETLDMRRVDRMLDLGGGSGVMSLALLRRHPRLTSVVLDIANVCVAGREIAAENSLANRIEYRVADFERDELPSGFGLALQCDVGPYEPALFHKIRAALEPGGRLVIVDQFAPAEGVAHPACLIWAFLGSLENPDASRMTAAEVQNRLAQAGFQILSERTLMPRDPVRWSVGWSIIEARK
jgi:ubiquinone/menaquinone biosynthesis C-methylase UbiE